MPFRVTPSIFISQAIQGARTHSAELLKLQQQASTGLRIHRPSDDPAAVRTLLAEKVKNVRFDAQLGNIQTARTHLNVSVTQLLEANSILVKAKDVALQANQLLDASEAEILASEIDVLIDRMLSIANTQDDSRYLYSGTDVSTAPFYVSATNNQGAPSQISYAGSGQNVEVPIGAGITVETLYSGAAVFQQRLRESTLVLGVTGAAAGTGTDSAVGQGILTVRNTSTSYAAGSGVQAGISSVGGDTVIGATGTHVLTINDTSGTGASGTVSINGGPAVAYTSSDSDLKVTGPGGEVIYIDTTAITAGFNGTVDIAAAGTLSTDGGSTEIAIDFSANQVVTNSATGTVTNIDSTGIHIAGSDHIEYVGTADAFGVLIELRDELRNVRQLPQDQWHDAIERRIADLDRVREDILRIIGQQSVSLENLDALERRSQDLQLETHNVISQLESADISEVVINLQNEQNLLQFTFAATSVVMDQSLLNFLA